MAEWDAAKGVLTVSGAAKVPFFNRRILAKQIGLAEDRHRHDRERRRRRLRRARRVLSRGFPDSVRGASRRAAGEVDRGPARKPDGDEPRARGRGRRRDRLRARWHHPGAARPRPCRLGAYMRTNGAVGARNIAQFMAGPYRVPNVKLDVSLWMTNKTPVGTYRGPGRFETDFFRERLLDMVAQDLGIDRVEFRRRNLIAHAEMPYTIATITPLRARTNTTAATTRSRSTAACEEIGWAEKAKLQGTAHRRPLSRPRRRLLHRGRRCGTEGKRAARDQRGRHDLGLHRLVGGRPGRRDGIRADRGRRARNPDGPHRGRPSRLDRLCQRRLWRLSFPLDRDGRLRAARCHQQVQRCAAGRRGEAARLRRRPRSASRTRRSAGPGGKSALTFAELRRPVG